MWSLQKQENYIEVNGKKKKPLSKRATRIVLFVLAWRALELAHIVCSDQKRRLNLHPYFVQSN